MTKLLRHRLAALERRVGSPARLDAAAAILLVPPGLDDAAQQAAWLDEQRRALPRSTVVIALRIGAQPASDRAPADGRPEQELDHREGGKATIGR